jgi:hypothetical protein
MINIRQPTLTHKDNLCVTVPVVAVARRRIPGPIRPSTSQLVRPIRQAALSKSFPHASMMGTSRSPDPQSELRNITLPRCGSIYY